MSRRPPDIRPAWVVSPTATIVLSTERGAALAAGDARRLYRLIHAAEATLAQLDVTRSLQTTIIHQLQRMAMTCVTLPAGHGFALVSSPSEAELLHMRGPVEERVAIGSSPDLRGASRWAAGRLAILVMSGDRSRLLLADRSRLVETTSHGFPLLRAPITGPSSTPHSSSLTVDYLQAVDGALTAALPEATPLVLAGDDPLTLAFYDRTARRRDIRGVLPGDHHATSAAALHAMARRLNRPPTPARDRPATRAAVERRPVGT